MQILYNNNIYIFFILDKVGKYLKTLKIYKDVYNRLYCLDKNIWNEIIVETYFSKFNCLSLLIPKSETASIDEMIRT